MTKEKIQYILERCIEANPSINDLVFGCRILDTNAKEHLILDVRPKQDRLFYDRYLTVVKSACLDTGKVDEIHGGYIEQIIGRTIRLADVLLAIGELGKKVTVCITESGDFGELSVIGSGIHSPEISWNLKQDDLTLQSEECIDFIYGLLHD